MLIIVVPGAPSRLGSALSFPRLCTPLSTAPPPPLSVHLVSSWELEPAGAGPGRDNDGVGLHLPAVGEELHTFGNRATVCWWLPVDVHLVDDTGPSRREKAEEGEEHACTSFFSQGPRRALTLKGWPDRSTRLMVSVMMWAPYRKLCFLKLSVRSRPRMGSGNLEGTERG